MTGTRLLLISALALLLPAAGWTQRRHDPLNGPEIDQLRDTAIEPEQRLKLYIKFARARLDSLAQLRSDPKTANRGQATHDGLQDFLDVYDELDDNVDAYADRRWDLRKALKNVLEADTEFQAQLRALRDSANAEKKESKYYEFVLASALDTVDGSTEDHRQLLKEQEDLAKHKKLIKPDAARQ